MSVGTGRQNIIILFWKKQFYFLEYINGNQVFILDSHQPFICCVIPRPTWFLFIIAIDWRHKFNVELEYIDTTGWNSKNIYQRQNSCLQEQNLFLVFIYKHYHVLKDKEWFIPKGVQKLFNVAALQNYSSSSSTYPAPQFSDIFHCAAQHYWTGAARGGGGGVALSANQGNCGLEDFFPIYRCPFIRTAIFRKYSSYILSGSTMREEIKLKGLPLMNKGRKILCKKHLGCKPL